MDRYEWTDADGHRWGARKGSGAEVLPEARTLATACIDEILRLAERLREAEELLREVEWQGAPGEDLCPYCFQVVRHLPGCRLHRFLTAGKEGA